MEYEEFLKHNELNNLYADDILKFNDQEDKFRENTKLVYKLIDNLCFFNHKILKCLDSRIISQLIVKTQRN